MKVIKLLQKESGYFAYIFITLGVLSGGLSALVMPFVSSIITDITSAGGVQDFNTKKALMYLGVVAALIVSQRIFSRFLIRMTQRMIHRLRLNVLDKVRKANYYAFEKIGKEKIYASVTTDAAVVSNSAANIVFATTSMVNVFFCLVYLAWISLAGLGITLLTITLGITFYWIRQKSIIKLFTDARNMENSFFKYIDELLSGFKEVKIDEKKNEDLYRNYIEKVSFDTREYTAKGILRYLDNSLVGQASFLFLVGVILFAFPVMNFDTAAIISYVFVILYIIGPIEGIMVMIPSITQANISLSHIEDISRQAEAILEEHSVSIEAHEEFEKLSLEQIGFQYDSSSGDVFSVGPIDLEVRRGEMIFIVGGNGSGKTTLFKLLTGLYEPNQGRILVNGKVPSLRNYRKLFAPIFSDFHLFERPYGYTIDAEKERQINQHIKGMGLEGKVRFENNAFSSTALSTGQRKRLALISCLVEEKPVIVLDEWAADQDPQFRKYFYREILPGLTAKGKTVIAITHDDHYFDAADRIYKMEYGKTKELSYA